MTDEITSEKGLEFFAMSEDLVDLPNIKQAGTSSVNFDGLLTESLQLQEDLKNGCGGQLWPAGMVLSKYMLRRFDQGELSRKSM